MASFPEQGQCGARLTAFLSAFGFDLAGNMIFVAALGIHYGLAAAISPNCRAPKPHGQAQARVCTFPQGLRPKSAGQKNRDATEATADVP